MQFVVKYGFWGCPDISQLSGCQLPAKCPVGRGGIPQDIIERAFMSETAGVCCMGVRQICCRRVCVSCAGITLYCVGRGV